MIYQLVGKHVVMVLGALATLALIVADSAAGTIINFEELPNEAGIHLTGFDLNGAPFDITKPDSETFQIGTIIVTGTDFSLRGIGLARSGTEILINILEDGGGPISDQVFVHGDSASHTFIDFVSDPDQFFSGIPFATVVETGSLQNVLNYTTDRGLSVSINVLSDVEVPEPTSFASLGAGLATFALIRRRKRAFFSGARHPISSVS